MDSVWTTTYNTLYSECNEILHEYPINIKKLLNKKKDIMQIVGIVRFEHSGNNLIVFNKKHSDLIANIENEILKTTEKERGIIEENAIEIHEQSTNILEKSLRTIEETIELGNQTIVKIDNQTDQLKNVNIDIDDIDEIQEKNDKKLKSILSKICCNKIMCGISIFLILAAIVLLVLRFYFKII